MIPRFKNKTVNYVLLAAVSLLLLLCPGISARAEATDEIKNFTITVDVNEDASLQMAYHIDWEVLDDSIGALEWIDLGVPNRNHVNITPLSKTIDHIEDNGSKLAIYLDRSYGEGETVSLDFSMTQDHMYQIDKWNEGETVFSFTPAWFDNMEVDRLVIRWNADKAVSWQPDCLQDGDYLVFESALSDGDKYTMSVTYPNDAFAFAVDRQADSQEEYENDSDSDMGVLDTFYTIVGAIIALAIIVTPFYYIFRFFQWILGGAGFGSSQKMEKKITRTKIEYFTNCPGCGAPREEGKDSCPYCGRSMIKNKEVVEESQIEHPERYTKNGTYRYGDSGNTFLLVNVVNVPRSGSSRSSRPSRSSSSRGSSHHSSCACACASSCACACACASSGRAGCSVKDFFKYSIHQGRVHVERKDWEIRTKEKNDEAGYADN